jgi:hypothetical protein
MPITPTVWDAWYGQDANTSYGVGAWYGQDAHTSYGVGCVVWARCPYLLRCGVRGMGRMPIPPNI